VKYGHKAQPVQYDPGDPFECRICGDPTVEDRHIGEPPPEKPLAPLNTPIAAGTSNVMGDRAVLANAPRLGTLRAAVVEAVAARPMTDDELEAHLDRTHQSVSACTNRLRADGWLVALLKDGQPVTRKTRSGNDASVWTLSVRAADRQPREALRGALLPAD
jgi:hypothetical protein